MFKILSLPVGIEKVNKDETLKEFSIKDIEKGEVLGGGSFGTTFIAKYNGKEVALKQLHARNDKVPKFLKKPKVMSCLMHENILGFEAVLRTFNVYDGTCSFRFQRFWYRQETHNARGFT